MRKKLFFLFLAIIASLSVVSKVVAIEQKSESFIPNLLGQNHSYSVTLRGNGEAVVLLKVILSNTSDQTTSTLDLRFPRVDPKDILVFQVIKENQCVRYKGEQLLPDRSLQNQPAEPVCEQYQEPDYFQYSYGQAKYQKAGYVLKGDTLTITLPKDIKPNGSGSFLVYYRGFGYVKKNIFGTYNFTFETPKVNDKIHSLQVGIDTDSDLILRGAKGKVSYRFEENLPSLKMAAPLVGAIANSQIDNLYQQIGYGTISKNASNLQPLDSYLVKGSYSDSRIKLYAKEITVITLISVIILFLIVFLAKKLVNNQPQTPKALTLPILNVIGLSFASSILIVFYTFLLFIINSLSRSYFDIYYFGELRVIMIVFLAIISVSIYSLLLIGPSLLMASKKGFGWGIVTFVLTSIWLLFYIIITLIIIFGLSRSPTYQNPILLEKSQSTRSIDK